MCARTALRGTSVAHPRRLGATPMHPQPLHLPLLLSLDFAQKQMRKKQLTLLGRLQRKDERWARRTEPRRSLRLLLLHVLVTEDDGVLYYVMNIFVLLFV